MKIIFERADSCHLVKEKSVANGHDCWGNTEWYSYSVIYINGEERSISDGWYVMHDGEKAIEVGLIYLLDKKIRDHLENSQEARDRKIKDVIN